MSKQLTAVEWLREQFHKVPQSQFGNMFEQAKEMERKQIEDAFEAGFSDGQEDAWDSDEVIYINGTDYYDETYGTDSN